MKLRTRTSADVPWINISKVDLTWAAIAPLLALLLRHTTLFDAAHVQASLIYAAVGAAVTVACFIKFRLVHSVSRFFSVDDALTVLISSAVAVISTVLVCFLLTRLDNVPRTVPVLHFAVLAGGSIALRLNRYLHWRRRGRQHVVDASVKNLVIVGASNLAWYYMQIVENLAGDRYNIVAVLDDDAAVQGRYVHGYPVAGRLRDIEAVITEYAIHGVPIHRLVVAVDWAALAPKSVEQMFRVAELRGIEVDTLAERLDIVAARAPAPISAANDDAVPSAVDSLFWGLKRAFDIVVAGAILLVTAPLAGVISILVLVDCGVPVMFWQVRIGRRGRKITVSKFRTLKAPYRPNGEAVANERRVSWFGRLLRRSHLDELPQLLSIVTGDMSLIGPRPLLPIDLPERVGVRFNVRPGITGWAQINGATLVTPREKIAMDEWYVRHASWKLELTIMAATIRALFMPVRRNEIAIAEALREQAALEEQIVVLEAEQPPRSTVAEPGDSRLHEPAEFEPHLTTTNQATRTAQGVERREARVSRA